MTNTYQMIVVSCDEGVCRITLNRPEKRNALHPKMIEELTAAVTSLPADTRMLILEGRGKAFCAGADLAYLRRLAEFSYEENVQDSAALMRLYRALYQLPCLVVSKVHGPALGGGMGFLLVSDFVFAAADAKLGFPEVRIGFVPALVSVFLLKKVSEGTARHLLLSGEIFSARQGKAYGLVTEVMDDVPALEARVNQFVAETLAGVSPQSVTHTRRLLQQMDEDRLDAALERAVIANARARETHDFKQGLEAFLRKEKIRWT